MDEELKNQAVKQVKEAMTVVYEIMDDSRLMKAIAKMHWRLYVNLKEEGFSPEQAMQIVTKFELKK